MPLTDAKIRALKPREKSYRLADGEGLFVQVNVNGSKLWRLAYRFEGKQKLLAIGAYPLIPLLEARRRRDEAKRMLLDGRDPSAEKKAGRKSSASENVRFRTVAEKWFKINESNWKPSHAFKVSSRLVNDVYPYIGDRAISDITSQEALDVIRRMEARGALDLSRRVYQMMGKVFRYAIGENIITDDPTRVIGDALAPPRKSKHRSALKLADLPEFFERLEAYRGEPVTYYGLKIVAHTFVRTEEIRFARPHELVGLDGPNPEWRIPPERMKVDDRKDQIRQEHIVPLSRQAAQYFRELLNVIGPSEWLFPGSANTRKSQPISQNTMIYAMYRMGYHSRATVHGFRSTASTALNEAEFNKDWVEMQLAHVDKSIRGIYNAALYLKQRRQMMQWYSDLIEPPVPADMFEDLLG